MAYIKLIKKLKDRVYTYYRRTKKLLEFSRNYVKCELEKIRVEDFFSIPIIINNFNQYEYLLKLIKALEDRGYHNIHILDNASTYPPLLQYYKECPYTVHHLGANLGYMALWKSGLFKEFRNQYFVYTDPDVVPVAECPADFMEYFYRILQKHPLSPKVGFSLKIDDIPNHYPLREKVIAYENKYWEKEISPGIFSAPLDTTFALHRPFTTHTNYPEDRMYRTGFPYQLRHLPWYVDPDHMTDNERYYANSCKTRTDWGGKIKESK